MYFIEQKQNISTSFYNKNLMVTFSLDVLHLYISMRQGGIQSPFRCSAVAINGLKSVSNFRLISAMFFTLVL